MTTTVQDYGSVYTGLGVKNGQTKVFGVFTDQDSAQRGCSDAMAQGYDAAMFWLTPDLQVKNNSDGSSPIPLGTGVAALGHTVTLN